MTLVQCLSVLYVTLHRINSMWNDYFYQNRSSTKTGFCLVHSGISSTQKGAWHTVSTEEIHVECTNERWWQSRDDQIHQQKIPLGVQERSSKSRFLPQGTEGLSAVHLQRSEIYFQKGCNFLSQPPFLFLVVVPLLIWSQENECHCGICMNLEWNFPHKKKNYQPPLSLPPIPKIPRHVHVYM